jgi:hypothetical protein
MACFYVGRRPDNLKRAYACFAFVYRRVNTKYYCVRCKKNQQWVWGSDQALRTSIERLNSRIKVHSTHHRILTWSMPKIITMMSRRLLLLSSAYWTSSLAQRARDFQPATPWCHCAIWRNMATRDTRCYYKGHEPKHIYYLNVQARHVYVCVLVTCTLQYTYQQRHTANRNSRIIK